MDTSNLIDTYQTEVKHEEDTEELCAPDVSRESQIFDNKIKIKIRLDLISVPIFAFPLCVGIVCLGLFIMEGRLSGYLPTISESGTEYQNKALFASMIACGSVTTFFIIFMYYNYVKLNYNLSRLLNIVFILVIMISCIGVGGFGFCPINEVYKYHFLFAFSGFTGILVFETLCYVVCRKDTNLAMVRLFLISFATIGYLIFGFTDAVFEPNMDATASAIGEWILLFCLQFVFVTYGQEMKHLKIHINLSV